MSTIAQQFGMTEALKQLGIAEINQGTSTGLNHFSNGEILESYSPVDGKLIASVKTSTVADYEKVMQLATEAFKTFRVMPAPQRGEIVRQFGEKLRKNKEALGKLVSYEMGKSLQEGYGEVQEMIDICDFAVGLSRQLHGLTMHSERPGHRMYEQYHPMGIVGIISAFNFPVAVWAWNTALAWICGDVCVWKPSEKTPLCGIACQKIIAEVIKENNLQTIEQFRQHQLKKELADLNETCEIIRKSIHKHQKPKWLLIAVTKADLFYDKLDEAREYYSPNGKSKFAKRLKDLQTQVGTDNFRWETVPVCAWLKDFEWNNEKQPSVLKVEERDHFIANFADEMANYSN